MRPQPNPEKWIEDVETIKIMADKRRLAILRLMQTPTTVNAIAIELNTAASKLYYHINLLEKHGLIQVIDHNIESGMVEKVYQVTAKQFKLVNPMLRTDLPDDTADALFANMLTDTQKEFRHAYANRDKDEQMPPRHPFLSKKAFRLTDSQLTQLHGKLSALIEEVTAWGELNAEIDAPLYDLTLVFFKHNPEETA